MKRFHLSPKAAQDMLDIQAYIASDSPAAARRTIDKIRAKIRDIAKTPWLGHLRDDLTDKPLYLLGVDNYIILYVRHLKPIRIMRVIHAARDLPAILRQL